MNLLNFYTILCSLIIGYVGSQNNSFSTISDSTSILITTNNTISNANIFSNTNSIANISTNLSINSTFLIKSEISNNSSSFPIPKFNDSRTAICITGQLRSGNLTWTSGKLRKNFAFNMFGPADPPSAIDTLIEFAIKPIAEYGGVDIFMYVTAHPETNISQWDGDPYNFEPVVGDTTVCEPFLRAGIFNNITNNRLFCLVEPEIQLMNPFIFNNPLWNSYTYGSMHHMREQVLQQLYGMYRANLASKQHALMSNIKYKYKVRMRPDTALTRPIPKLNEFDFIVPNQNKCKSTVYYSNPYVYKNGAEDMFNIGLADAMDRLLDRYIDLISEPFVYAPRHSGHWDLEDHLVGLMEMKYNICITYRVEIWLVPIRKSNAGFNSWLPPHNHLQWKQLYN